MLKKEEYKILYYIERGRTNLTRLESIFNKKELIKILEQLEKNNLIKINKEMESFMETKEGREELSKSIYKKWFEELGD